MSGRRVFEGGAQTGDFGGWLRQRREQAGVTVERIAHLTKVTSSRIRALERNDLGRWPGGIFRRGFIRTYAELVGLDPDETVAAFLRAFPDEESELTHTAVSAHGDEQLRLVLVEDTLWWRTYSTRLGAALTDLMAPIVLALPSGLFGGASVFWLVLAVLAVLYLAVSTLVLGMTPGMWMTGRGGRPWRRRPKQAASNVPEVAADERAPDAPLERQVSPAHR